MKITYYSMVASAILLAGSPFVPPSQAAATTSSQVPGRTDISAQVSAAPARYIVYTKNNAQQAVINRRFFDGLRGVTFKYNLDNVGAKAIDVTDSSVLEQLAANPNVARIEKDVIRRSLGGRPTTTAGSVTMTEEVTKMLRRAAASESAVSASSAAAAAAPTDPTYGLKLIGANVTPFNKNVTSSDLAVCIIDSGVNGLHPGLSGVDIRGVNTGSTTDDCGHGTHVTGTLAGPTAIGVANGVRIYEVQVYSGSNCDWSFSSDLIAATNLCKQAAGPTTKLIISMSLGGPDNSTAEADAFSLLDRDGVLSIAAAGNDGIPTFSYPASYPSVVSVAAVDEFKNVAWFSQQNSQVDLSAPGVDVYSTYLNNGYDYMSGTSMATPHVSGAAAVVWSYGLAKGWTNAQVRDALQTTALDLGKPGRDDAYGYGLINVCKAAKLAGFDSANAVSCPY